MRVTRRVRIAAGLGIGVVVAGGDGGSDDDDPETAVADDGRPERDRRHRATTPPTSVTTTSSTTTTTPITTAPASDPHDGADDEPPAPPPTEPPLTPPAPPRPMPTSPPWVDPRPEATDHSASCRTAGPTTVVGTAKVVWSDGFVDEFSVTFSSPGYNQSASGGQRGWWVTGHVVAPPPGTIGDYACHGASTGGPVRWDG